MTARDTLLATLLIALGASGTLLFQKLSVAPAAPGRAPRNDVTGRDLSDLKRRLNRPEKSLLAEGQENSRLLAADEASLQFTKFSDAGLRYVERLPSLRFLDVRRPQTTAAAGKSFANTHPRCRVIY